MKPSISFVVMLCSSVIFLISCNPKYPDLDTTTMDKLSASEITGLWMTPVKGTTVTDTIGNKLRCASACATITRSFGYVIYPYVVCRPPDFTVTDALAVQLKESKQDSLIPFLSGKDEPTHVVRNKAVYGYKSIFCKEVGGPWGATLEEKELCGFCGDGPHQYTLEIGGLPGHPAWSWIGTPQDAPPGTPDMSNMAPNSSIVIDCNPGDLTNCGGQVMDPNHPAIMNTNK